MLDDLGGEDPGEGPVGGSRETLQDVPLPAVQAFVQADVDHLAVEVDALGFDAVLPEELQELAPAAAEVEDLAALPEEGGVAGLLFPDVLLGAAEPVLEPGVAPILERLEEGPDVGGRRRLALLQGREQGVQLLPEEKELLHQDLDVLVLGGELVDAPFHALEDHADVVASQGVPFPVAGVAQGRMFPDEVEGRRRLGASLLGLVSEEAATSLKAAAASPTNSPGAAGRLGPKSALFWVRQA